MSVIEFGLEDRLSEVLESHPHLQRRKLRFETNQGHVVLRGVVGSFYEKQMAQEALRRIDGIERIENELEVSWA